MANLLESTRELTGREGNRKKLPQHGMPNLALSLMLNNFTEKNLRRLFFNNAGERAGVGSQGTGGKLFELSLN